MFHFEQVIFRHTNVFSMTFKLQKQSVVKPFFFFKKRNATNLFRVAQHNMKSETICSGEEWDCMKMKCFTTDN